MSGRASEKNHQRDEIIEIYSAEEYEETIADDEEYISPSGDVGDNSDFDSEEDWMSAKGEDDYDPAEHIDYSIYGDV